MPLTPALVGRPLSFHSEKADYILYQGTACDNSGGWGSLCHDEVSICTLLGGFVAKGHMWRGEVRGGEIERSQWCLCQGCFDLLAVLLVVVLPSAFREACCESCLRPPHPSHAHCHNKTSWNRVYGSFSLQVVTADATEFPIDLLHNGRFQQQCKVTHARYFKVPVRP